MKRHQNVCSESHSGGEFQNAHLSAAGKSGGSPEWLPERDPQDRLFLTLPSALPDSLSILPSFLHQLKLGMVRKAGPRKDQARGRAWGQGKYHFLATSSLGPPPWGYSSALGDIAFPWKAEVVLSTGPHSAQFLHSPHPVGGKIYWKREAPTGPNTRRPAPL